MNAQSSRGKYVLAALVGAAAGGAIVALSTRAIPKMLSTMMAQCEGMMAGMAKADAAAESMCRRMRTEVEPVSEEATCGSSCNA